MAVYHSVTELIGKTPIMEAENIEKELGLKAKILVKLEYFNPAGSVKDRVALNMIEDAEKSGRIRPGATIIEPTSGTQGSDSLPWQRQEGTKPCLSCRRR